MKGKPVVPLAARIAALQIRVIALTLLLVTLATTAMLSLVLSRSIDQHLQSVLQGVSRYLAEKPAAEMDWHWLAGEVQEVRPSNFRVELLDSKGEPRFFQGDGPPLRASVDGCSTEGSWRLCAGEARGFRLIVGKNREEDVDLLRTVAGLLALLSLAACVGVAVLSRGATRRATEPLTQLAAKVAELEPGSGARLELHSSVAEVDLLAQRFDALVARFEEALDREKRFTAEASHELRTPLTLALAEMEALARGEGDGAEPTRALGALNRLAQLAESLLWFARAQGKIVDDRTDVVNICDLIRTQVGTLTQAHPEKRFRLELPDEALVQAEEPLIARALGNLLDNAIKYGDESDIQIKVERGASGVQVTVVNGGLGISEAARARVFVPFFRSTDATTHAEGFGLGLPFARAVARAHGGDLRLGAQQRTKTELVLELPLVGWSEAAALGQGQSPPSR
jgi:signal transduction histidine kinase